MSTTVFDEQGRAWNGSALSLRRLLAYDHPDVDLLTYAVKNMGFVALTVTRHAVRLRVRPETASPEAMTEAYYWLTKHHRGRVVLSLVGDGSGCRDEVLPDQNHVAGRLAELAAGSDAGTLFRSAEVNLNEVRSNLALNALFECWRRTEQVYSSAEYASVTLGPLAGRFTVASAACGDAMVLYEVGRGFRVYTPGWSQVARGRTVEDQPDYTYGLWVRDRFRTALGERRPRLEDVDALIRCPSRGPGRQRIRYRRLLLPCRLPSGDAGVLSGSVVNDGIDLRANGGAVA